MKPSDLPEGSLIQLTVEDGKFSAAFCRDPYTRVADGFGTGGTIEDAVREALDEAEQS